MVIALLEDSILQTGKQKRGKQKSRDGESVGRTLLGLRLLLPWCATRSRERSEEGFVLDGLRETRRAKNMGWRAGCRKARTTPGVRRRESTYGGEH